MVKQHDVEEWEQGRRLGNEKMGLEEGNHVKREEPE